MKKWDYDGAPLRTDSLLPTSRNKKCWYMSADERKVAISTMPNELDLLPRPGLKDIKFVELFTKWRPILPSWARDSTCPKPPDEVLERVKASRTSKSKERAGKKRKLDEDDEDYFEAWGEAEM